MCVASGGLEERPGMRLPSRGWPVLAQANTRFTCFASECGGRHEAGDTVIVDMRMGRAS